MKKKSLMVSTRLKDDRNQTVVSSLEKTTKETLLKFNGKKVAKASEQALNIPLFLVTLENNGYLMDTPRERRHWLDWALFHVEPGYIEIWEKYHHTLRYRNALLREKTGGDRHLSREEIMVDTAMERVKHRHNYIKQIERHIDGMPENTFGEIVIQHKPAMVEIIGDYLTQNRASDIRAGYTQTGPHRAVIKFLLGNMEAGRILSRGQLKLLRVLLTTPQVIGFIERTPDCLFYLWMISLPSQILIQWAE